MKKPELFGKIFRAFLENQISIETYEELATALDKVRVQSLPWLEKFYEAFDFENYDSLMENSDLPHTVIQDLVLAGLIDIRFMPGVIINTTEFQTGVSRIGKLFVQIALS